MIRAIIFDFYGVISTDIGTRWYLTRPSPEKVAELKTKYDAPADKGNLTEDEFFNGISGAVNSTGVAIRAEWLDLVEIDIDLVAYIRSLKEKYQIALCSNATHQLVRDILKRDNLKDLFNITVLSSEISMTKPNPDIFRYTLEQLGVAAEQAVFIDDRSENVDAAQALGLRSIVYTDLVSLQRDLEALVKF